MIGSTLSTTDYLYPAVLPWKEIFTDLKAAGVSRKLVADLVGAPWTTVQRWHVDGIEPRYSKASAILVLHSRYCGELATQKRISEAKAEF